MDGQHRKGIRASFFALPEQSEGQRQTIFAVRYLGNFDIYATFAVVTFPCISTRQTNPPPSRATAMKVKRFLGEGGKKVVYLAHDTLLDRDVAFALLNPPR